MTRQISVNGALTAQPGAYQLPVKSSGGVRVVQVSNSTVCCIGQCTGGANPAIVYDLRDDGQIDTLFKSGNLYDMIRVQFARGVSRVIAVRAGDQTQAEGDFEDGSSNDLINLTSVDYGLEASKVGRKVESGTNGAFGVKATISKVGESSEVGDNLGFLPAAIIRYTGDGSASTAALSRTALTVTVTGSSDGSAAFTLNLTSTMTVSEVVAHINAQAGFEAEVTGGFGEMKAQELDFFAAADIKTETGTVSMDSATRVDFSSGSITGLDDEDVVKIVKSGQVNEYLYTVSGSTPEFLRGYNGSLPQVWASASAVTFKAFTRTNKALIDFCNTSSRLTAVRNTSYNNGRPSAPASSSLLTGATSPAVTNSDYETALSLVESEFYRYGVMDSTEAGVHSFVESHLVNRWGTAALYGSWDLGTAKDEAESVIRGRAATLNNKDITLHFQDVNLPDKDGTDTNFDPWMTAALAAAERATTQEDSPIAKPLTGRTLPGVTDLDQGFTLNSAAIERLLQAGVCVSRYDSSTGRYIIIRALTTYTGDDKLENIDSQVRGAVGWVLYKVNASVKANYIGQKAMNNADTLRGILVDVLDEVRDEDEVIAVGSKIEGGERVTVPAYEITSVKTQGNTTPYSYKFTPVNGRDFAIGQGVVQQYTDTL